MEKQHKFLFIPVNTGDTLYLIERRNKPEFQIIEVYVARVRTDTDLKTDYINSDNYTRLQIFVFDDNGYCFEIKGEQFGKTVFFNKNDAEQALKQEDAIDASGYVCHIEEHANEDAMLSILSDCQSEYDKACLDARRNGIDQPDLQAFMAKYLLENVYCIFKK